MMKDTFFSMPRFVNLCRKEMLENWKSNLLRLVLLYGVMAIVMVWNGYFEYNHVQFNTTDPAWVFLLVVFMWALWGFGCLSASFTMEKMKSKTGRLSILMSPATSFEKFFSRWFIFPVVFLVVFLITYRLADYTRVLVYSLAYPELKNISPVDLSHLIGDADYYTLCRNSLEFAAIIAGYFFAQSCFVLGSSVWPKNSFIKTFATVAIIVIIYLSVGTILGKTLFLSGVNGPLNAIFMEENSLLKFLIITCSLFTLLNWTLAYFRFKESEIINRM